VRKNFGRVDDFCNILVVILAPDPLLKVVDIDPVVTETNRACTLLIVCDRRSRGRTYRDG
jgi:hypothetical protein